MTARLSVTAVRYATRTDLEHLAGVEGQADSLFRTLWEDAGQDWSDWPGVTAGESRAAQPGFILAVGQPLLGFAQVLDLGVVGGSGLHLEQIAVCPDAMRQGIGRMLIRAAMGVALDRGARELTLMTYADVAWNGPWYAREGFVPVTPESHPERWAALSPLRASEERMGLARAGRRTGMVAQLEDAPEPRRAVSVILVRQREAGLEVFVQHRALTMDFAPGAVVFPGGRVDETDATHAYDSADGVLRACAVREVAEETGARINAADLIPWDRWITPIGYPKRFDVEFFILPVEDGAQFVHATREATHSEWLGVDALVNSVENGSLWMVPPTRTIVDELSALGSLDAVVTLRPTVRPVRHDLAGPRPRQGG